MSNTEIIRKEILKVRNLLSDPNKWTKRSWARDKDNKIVPAVSQSACKWCLEGAFEYFGTDNRVLKKLNKYVDKTRPNCNVVDFNDGSKTTHKDVLSLLDDFLLELEKDAPNP